DAGGGEDAVRAGTRGSARATRAGRSEVMTRPLRDPDLLELLADKPELLAIADAVAATQQPPRRTLLHRRSVRVGVVAAAALVAVVVALVLPRGNSGIVDRALAAIGTGSV